MTSWLVTKQERLRIGRGGLVIGRRPDCDLVVRGDKVSRRHALVRATGAGVEVVHIGKGPTLVNGAAVRDVAALAHDDVVQVGDTSVRVAVSDGEDAPEQMWVLETPGGTLCGLRRSPFVVGGAPGDDLVLAGWPAAGAQFHVLVDGLVVEVSADARVRGKAARAGDYVSLGVGDKVEFGGTAISVLAAGQGTEGTTRLTVSWSPPTFVGLHFHERGGLLTMDFPAADRVSVHLPDRRCDLVAALLQPPGGLRAGDDVSDDALAPRVWPGQPGKGRTDINLLLHRTRRSLLEAGVDGPALLLRADGGGASRIALAKGAKVTVA